MQKHGNGLLIGIGILLLIAVIFFGIAVTNAIDTQRFAMENLQTTILEFQDQNTFGMQPFMTHNTSSEDLKKTQEALKTIREELKKAGADL